MRSPVYVAGPMSGLPDLNYPEFYRVARLLRTAGKDVRNPATIGEWAPEGMPWEWYLRMALKMVLDCNTIVLLEGYQNSRGAMIEKALAEQIGMEVYLWRDLWRDLKSLHDQENSSTDETMDAASAAVMEVPELTGITDEHGTSVIHIDTARATGSLYAGPAIPGLTPTQRRRRPRG